jgi:hypothetical protein
VSDGFLIVSKFLENHPPKTLSFLKNLSVPRKGKKALRAALGQKVGGKGEKAKIPFESVSKPQGKRGAKRGVEEDRKVRVKR